jgi:Ion channel
MLDDLEPPDARSAGHRYAAILLLAVVTVVFLVVAPDRAGCRAVALLLSGSMLLAVVVTSRSRISVRRKAAGALVLGTALLALAVAVDAVPGWLGSLVASLLLIATLGQLVRGLARLLREQGVTPQAVAGALAVYLLLGVVFALAIGVAARLHDGPWFAQGTDGTTSDQLYFSFTALTTTGFGDLSAGTRGGRALTVLEMLTGQIYLVTVIALLVGNLRRRTSAPG